MCLQVASNLRNSIDAWNKGTNRWLRIMVYERVRSHSTALTYGLSALWHGFYPGYYLTFASGALFTFGARAVSLDWKCPFGNLCIILSGFFFLSKLRILWWSCGVTKLNRIRNDRITVKLSRRIIYSNAGTVEFLVDKENKFFFIEINPRLKMAHTLKELITGLDIVQSQIKIAHCMSLTCAKNHNYRVIILSFYSVIVSTGRYPYINSIVLARLSVESLKVSLFLSCTCVMIVLMSSKVI